MQTTTKHISRGFLTDMEHEKTQLSFGADNLAFMIESIRDTFRNSPGAEAFEGALWCVYNQLKNVQDEMTSLIEAEYAKLRGEHNG